MTDLVDHAQALEQRLRDAAIGAQARKSVPRTVASAECCIDPNCGTRIPEARRLAVPGVQLCVDCQARRERTRAGRAD